MPLDVVFGSLATLLGALGTWYIRRFNLPDSKARWLAPLPPIIANTLIVPFVLAFVYQFEGSIPYFMVTVGAGEVISCGVFGVLLFGVFRKYDRILF